MSTERDLQQHEKMLAAFAAELPPQQREEFFRNGLGAVPRDFTRRGGMTDLSDREDLAEPECIESPIGTDDIERIHEALRRVIGELLADSDRDLGVECISLATGICYQGNSEAEIARRNGVKRAAVSKRVRAIVELLHLPPSRAMRSLTAVRTYVKNATAIHHSRDARFLPDNANGPKVHRVG